MKKLLGLIAVLAFASPANAEWSIEAMNAHVDQTSFIVDGQCSGTLISATQRLLLTNFHCIGTMIRIVEEEVKDDDGSISKKKLEKYESVPVTQGHYKDFAEVGSSSYLTEIVAHDRKRDLAVLQFKQDKIPFALAAPFLPDGEKLLRGQPTITVGNPAGLEATIIRGEISSLTRVLELGGEKRDYIQFSGGLYGGNSGGALYNDNGQLIGVPAVGFRNGPTYIGFAIPIMTVKDFLKLNCLASVFDSKADDAKCKSDKEAKAEDGK